MIMQSVQQIMTHPVVPISATECNQNVSAMWYLNIREIVTQKSRNPGGAGASKKNSHGVLARPETSSK